MKPIYQPKGRAFEYSPFALNLYTGCDHKCDYCYAPASIHKTKEEYFCKPEPRKGLVEALETQCRIEHESINEQVLLSFVGDPYTPSADDNEITREALKVLLKYKIPTAILTKGGLRCLRDVDLFKQFGDLIQVGQSITWGNHGNDVVPHESGASPIRDRIVALTALKGQGIRTFASFEPVFDPDESLKAMGECAVLNCVDNYKIGKLNHHPKENEISWDFFLMRALKIVRATGMNVYIKKDLREACPSVYLSDNEKNAVRQHVRRVK
jgi:DNA repair photolyase